MAPSILSADAARLAEEVKAVESAGADLIHVDVMDGHFVPNLTYGPHVVRSLRPLTELPLDCHLMVTDPAHYAREFLRAGADLVSFHWELPLDHGALLREIHQEGGRAGVAVNPSTPLDSGLRDLLPLCDLVLVMSVHPGFSGQTFDAGALPKLRTLRQWREEDGLDGPVLEIDGGIDPETARQARAAGAEILVSGSTLFSSDDYAAMMAALRGEASSDSPTPALP